MSDVLDDVMAELTAMGWTKGGSAGQNAVKHGPDGDVLDTGGTTTWARDVSKAIERAWERRKPKPGLDVFDLSRVNRLEVINHTTEGKGREYICWKDGIRVEVVLQDGKRTMKIFIINKVPE